VTQLDLLYLGLVALLLLFDGFYWSTLLRRPQGDLGRLRARLWSVSMLVLWTLVAVGIALWRTEARTWTSLRLTMPHGWRLWGALGLVLALAFSYGNTVVRLATRPRARTIKLGNPHAALYAPHTRPELGMWIALSLTAGVCEELIFRGYLLWSFTPLLGLWGAAAVSVVFFGLAHAYQGPRGIVTTGVVGGLLTGIVLLSGSLVPAIALHSLADIGEGLVAWLVLRDQGMGGTASG
jgi:membrane protease YdiL (CAAX protease family)